MVTLPGVEGQLGILPQHISLLTEIVPGELFGRKDSQDHFLAIGDGVVEIAGDHMNILTVLAIEAEKIDEARVEEARQRAEVRVREKLSVEEVTTVNAALARSLAELRVKRRQRG
jgi:F-type H+-transporting ATPase subunit epsilon